MEPRWCCNGLDETGRGGDEMGDVSRISLGRHGRVMRRHEGYATSAVAPHV